MVTTEKKMRRFNQDAKYRGFNTDRCKGYKFILF